ncbi:hypothetical protein RHSIM_Rhsim02G0078900 [Rhododendron simsii]|uniref:FAR1 domain-containing protein n=1 Tax=Rhododendron simsii TaxID=118357 RepID=A0A834H9N8_RHOSS|nr:hypothetical protein RHSIM_Rhsim02G0078900 [Rhododendron simsii]
MVPQNPIQSIEEDCEVESNDSDIVEGEVPVDSRSSKQQQQKDSIATSRPKRVIRVPTRYVDMVAYALPVIDVDIPSTFKEAWGLLCNIAIRVADGSILKTRWIVRNLTSKVYMETPVQDKFITTESLVGAKLDLLDVGTNQAPNEGMSFESDEAAKAFYDEYARRIGFLTRIVSSRKSERDGSVISRRLACNKEGYNRNSQKTGLCQIRKRESHREGCMAMVLVKREKLGEWVVKKFVREYNHPLEVSSEKWRPNPELSTWALELEKQLDLSIPRLNESFDEDQKVRELSSQLHHANQQLEACQEQLRTITACMEKHTQCLSTTVESVVSNVKQVESQQHEISGHC